LKDHTVRQRWMSVWAAPAPPEPAALISQELSFASAPLASQVCRRDIRKNWEDIWVHLGWGKGHWWVFDSWDMKIKWEWHPLKLFSTKPTQLHNHGNKGRCYCRAYIGPSTSACDQELKSRAWRKPFTCLFSKHLLHAYCEGWGCGSVVIKCLRGIRESLGLIPSTTKTWWINK
jgi:hypothetical protein